MKKLVFIALLLCIANRITAQQVGIGTNAPLSKLHIDSGGLLITGSTGAVPLNGAGTRFMWVPSKAAARFGKLDAIGINNWHTDSIGYYSLAAGKNAKAKGDSASIALGWNVNAAGAYGSIALGDFATVTGNSGAAAIGSYVSASGQSSIALGQSVKATGNFSHSIGNSSQAGGYASYNFGTYDTATGDYSMAIGMSNTATGMFANAFGYGLKSTNINSMAIGQFSTSSGYQATSVGLRNLSSGNYSFTFGDTDTANAANSIAVGLFNKATAPFAKAFGSGVKASGQSSMAVGDQVEAAGNFSQAYGNFSRSSGPSSFIFGNNDTATADYSMAIGTSAYAKGIYSFAAGFVAKSNAAFSYSFGTANTANGNSSFAIGNNNTSFGMGSIVVGSSSAGRGDYSFTGGYQLKQKSYGGFAAGLFNDTLDNGFLGAPIAGNRIFQIGNGTADNARSNALTVLQNGNVGIGILNPGTKLDVFGNTAINNSTLLLRNATDLNHGLRFDTLTDGPCLFGYTGGVLGAIGEPHSLSWAYTGNVSIRNQLNVGTGIIVDTANDNNGALTNALIFGTASGEGIASKRTGGGNQYGLDFYTNSVNRLSISNTGTVQVANNITVQNGKGLLRSIDGTQKKQVAATVTVNTSFTAGQTLTFPISWPEAFSGAPDAYVGNVVSGTGGWAEVVMSIGNTNTLGATLYVFNPRSTPVSPNFTIKIIAIGPQ